MSSSAKLPSAFTDVFIGRQPILDVDNHVYGYELLFRNGYDHNFADFDDEDEATATVLNNALMGIGLNELVGTAKAFVNFPESFFHLTSPPFFNPDSIVCEVLENIEPTPEVIVGLKYLKSLGYKIALDDFIFKKKFIPFIELADFIKVDISTVKPENLTLVFERIRKVSRAKLLAERVETKDEFEVCLQAGCVFFQGSYFAKPQIVVGKKLSINQLNLVELLAKIADEKASIEGLLLIIEKDMGLAHKLLKVATHYRSVGMPRFESLQGAMMLFGLRRVQSWVSMIAIGNQPNVAPEVYKMARIRAIFLRSLALKNHYPNADTYYLAGLFSMLDVVLGCTLETALESLPLSEMLTLGVIERQGEVGHGLDMVEALETSRDKPISSDIRALYLQAVREVNAVDLLI